MIRMLMFRRAGGVLAILLFTSCSSVQSVTRSGEVRPKAHRFHEETQTDMIVRFAGWNSIRILRPDTTEDGFIPVFNWEESQRVLAKPEIGRNLAVVVCGFGYRPDDEAKQQSRWASVLSELGYRRVTFVRMGRGGRLNGWAILKDERLDRAAVTGG